MPMLKTSRAPGRACATSFAPHFRHPPSRSGSNLCRPVSARGSTLYISAPESRPDLGRAQVPAPSRGRACAAASRRCARSGCSRRARATLRNPRRASRNRRGPCSHTHAFDRFVIGPGNRLAHAAALAVAELPGEAYNPLFLHGAPGLGKTHLLGAIALYLRRNRPDLTVRYTTAERFTQEFVTALRMKGAEAFKERYRGLNVLLIDDVQFLEDKPHTEEEFFHTFNALYEAGGQLVLSCDRPPEALSKLAERLRDRFDWGLRGRARGAGPADAHHAAPAPREPRARRRDRRPTRCARSPCGCRATSAASRAPSSASSRSRRSRAAAHAGLVRDASSSARRPPRRSPRPSEATPASPPSPRSSRPSAPCFIFQWMTCCPRGARRRSHVHASSPCICHVRRRGARSSRSHESSTAITAPCCTRSDASRPRSSPAPSPSARWTSHASCSARPAPEGSRPTAQSDLNMTT